MICSKKMNNLILLECNNVSHTLLLPRKMEQMLYLALIL